MSNTCAQGIYGELCVEPGTVPYTFDTSSELYEFRAETLSQTINWIDVAGMQGTRQRRADSVVDGAIDVNGDVTLFLTANNFKRFCDGQRILGGTAQPDTPSAGQTTYGYADSINPFGVLVDRIASNTGFTTFEYRDCYVNSCRISGRSGEEIQVVYNLLGKVESYPGSAFPAYTAAERLTQLGTGIDDQPFVMHEAVFSYSGNTYEFNEFELMINNHLQARRENSQTAVAICSTDLEVTLRINAPWIDDFTVDYEAGPDTTPAYLQFAKSTVFIKFAFGSLHQKVKAPTIVDKGQIRWPLELEARMVQANPIVDAVNVIIDNTV